MLGPSTLNAVSLGVPEERVGWYPACSSVFALVSQLVTGRLLVGRARTPVMRAGALVVAIASLLGVVALSAPMLFAVVALFATGYGILQSGAILLVTEAAPAGRRGQAVGLYGSFTTMGVLIGPALGVALLQHQGGEAVFGLTLLLALAALACALLLRAPPRRRGGVGGGGRRLRPLVRAAALGMFGMTAAWGAVLAFLPLYALGPGLAKPGLY